MFVFRKKIGSSPFFNKIFFHFESHEIKASDDVLRLLNIDLLLYTKKSPSKYIPKMKLSIQNIEKRQPVIYFVKGFLDNIKSVIFFFFSK